MFSIRSGGGHFCNQRKWGFKQGSEALKCWKLPLLLSPSPRFPQPTLSDQFISNKRLLPSGCGWGGKRGGKIYFLFLLLTHSVMVGKRRLRMKSEFMLPETHEILHFVTFFVALIRAVLATHYKHFSLKVLVFPFSSLLFCQE